jgi:hypothetical protein
MTSPMFSHRPARLRGQAALDQRHRARLVADRARKEGKSPARAAWLKGNRSGCAEGNIRCSMSVSFLLPSDCSHPRR